MHDLLPAEADNLIRLERAEAPHFGAPGRLGFHLIDTTMMYAPRSGGVKRYLTAKRDWILRRRPDLRHTLVVPGAATDLESPGVVTIAAPRLPFADGYRMPASPARWEMILRLLQPDIIEAGDIFAPGHAAIEAGQALAAPVVGFCHTDAAALAALHLGDWAQAPAMKRWAEVFKRFDRVVAPSRHIAARLAEAGVDRVTVQRLGVDLDLFHPSRADPQGLRRRLGLPSGARLLIFAGRPAREKNIEAMVCAVERLGSPYHLLLVGAGKDVRLSPRVIALDYESDPRTLAGLIASCDAALHANENEPFGLVVLEALAAGTPVVGPSRGGVGELIDETVGQRADGVDPADLAEAIEALFARDVDAVSVAARRRAELRHGWASTFEGLTRLYSEMVSGRPAPAMLSA